MFFRTLPMAKQKSALIWCDKSGGGFHVESFACLLACLLQNNNGGLGFTPVVPVDPNMETQTEHSGSY